MIMEWTTKLFLTLLVLMITLCFSRKCLVFRDASCHVWGRRTLDISDLL